jgi:hypothetical protein
MPFLWSKTFYSMVNRLFIVDISTKQAILIYYRHFLTLNVLLRIKIIVRALLFRMTEMNKK